MDEEVEVGGERRRRARRRGQGSRLAAAGVHGGGGGAAQELPIEPGALVLYRKSSRSPRGGPRSTTSTGGLATRYGEAMKSTLLETEFDTADTEIYKTFHDVTTLTDVWWYLQGPLIGALYSETSYTGQPLPPERLRFVNDNNKLLGKVRLQQVRVAPNVGCRVADWAASNSSAAHVSECYPEWSEVRFSRHDRAPIVVNARGPQECAKADGADGDEPAIACETQTYERVSRRGTGLAPFRGWLYWYDGSGYMLELPNDYTAARTLLAQLRADDCARRADARAVGRLLGVQRQHQPLLCRSPALRAVAQRRRRCEDARLHAHGPGSHASSPPPPWYARRRLADRLIARVHADAPRRVRRPVSAGASPRRSTRCERRQRAGVLVGSVELLGLRRTSAVHRDGGGAVPGVSRDVGLRAQMAESPDDSYFNFQNVAAYAEMESTATAFSAVLTYLKVLAYLARASRG